MKKQLENVELPPFKKTGLEDLFFNTRETDGYNKIWNLFFTPRGVAKSTDLIRKVYNAFRKEGRPSVILLDHTNDITDTMIEDLKTQYLDWTGIDLPFQYSKSSMDCGVVDIKLNGKIFIRYHSFNTDVNRLKRFRLDDCKYFFVDEYIKNTRAGEKYIKDQYFKIKELYNTYQRYVKKKEQGDKIKIYLYGNTYSRFCPIHTALGIPTEKLVPGAIVQDKDWIIQCYQMKPELKEYILKTNPMYEFDDAYKSFAMDGSNPNDKGIRIVETQPNNFKLSYLFKINDRYLGVFRGQYIKKDGNNIYLDYCYWTCKYDSNEGFSKRREVVCFDFGQMEDGAILCSTDYKTYMTLLKEAIRKRLVVHQSIESSYMMEEIYQML